MHSQIFCRSTTNTIHIQIEYNSPIIFIIFCHQTSPYVMPILFQQYFISEFNLLDFCKANECYIREQAIKSFIRNATLQQKYKMILKMFVDYKRQLEGIVIHNDFPKKTLVEHFSSIFILVGMLFTESRYSTHKMEIKRRFTVIQDITQLMVAK